MTIGPGRILLHVLPPLFSMQGLKKYLHLVSELQQDGDPVPPQALFRLNRTLELELLLAQREIDHWGRQIQSVEQRIQDVRGQEEEASSSVLSPEQAEGAGDVGEGEEVQVQQQYLCPYPNCHRSFHKESTLRCHQWLSHRQELTWQGSLKLQLEQHDSQQLH